MEPIVPRDVIRDRARAAFDAGLNLHEDPNVNPYPEGTAAHAQFERDYWERAREVAAEVID